MDVACVELMVAWLSWIERAVPIIGQQQVPMRPSMDYVVREDGASGTGKQIPNWEHYVRNARAPLIELPETGALLDLARATPALEQVLLREGVDQPIAEERQREHLIDRYLQPFAIALLKRSVEERSPENASFSTVYGQFEQFVFHYEDLPYSILVQFSNFRSALPVVELEPGVRIRLATPEEQNLALRTQDQSTIFGLGIAALIDTESLQYGRFPTEFDRTPYVFLEIDLHYGRYPHMGPNTGFTYDDGYERADQLLSGLHLLDDRFVMGYALWYVDTNPFQRFGPRRTDYSLRKIPRSGPGGYYVLDEDKAQKLQEMWPMLASPDRDLRVDLALRRLDSVYERRMPEDKLLDYWIALEALFLPGEGGHATSQASRRVARYLSQIPDERAAISDAIRDSYNTRSRIVHGDRPGESTDLEKTVAATGGLLRRALMRALTSGEPPHVTRLDRDLPL